MLNTKQIDLDRQLVAEIILADIFTVLVDDVGEEGMLVLISDKEGQGISFQFSSVYVDLDSGEIDSCSIVKQLVELRGKSAKEIYLTQLRNFEEYLAEEENRAGRVFTDDYRQAMRDCLMILCMYLSDFVKKSKV